eukprot:scaffold16821_cov42-Phaeocystis_antarctica.AAC.1
MTSTCSPPLPLSAGTWRPCSAQQARHVPSQDRAEDRDSDQDPARQALAPEEGCGHQVQGCPPAQVAVRLLRAELRRRRRSVIVRTCPVPDASVHLRVLCGAREARGQARGQA